jgi:leucyl aminopeptidase
MVVNVQAFQPKKYTADVSIVFVLQDKDTFSQQKKMITDAWESSSATFATDDFTGAADSSAVVYTGEKKSPRLVMVGLGEQSKLSIERIRRAAALAAQRATALKCSSLAILLPDAESVGTPSDIAQAVIEAVVLGTYSFDKYRSTTNGNSNNKRTRIDKVLLMTSDKKDVAEAKRGATSGASIANGVVFARDLVNAPSNEIYPEALAQQADEQLSAVGVKVRVLDKKKIQQHNMQGLLAVNQGSLRPPVFIIMEWMGGPKKEAPIVLVGKGITFDSGGISIKPAAGMGDMKMDMGGSGAVIGAMRAIAELKLPHNVIGLVPSTENLPSGSAYKPGDVITYSNGKSVEVDNTDAEGRLVLADALIYADQLKPQAVIDLATLTGAAVVAVGNVATALMGTSEELNARLKQAADRTYDRVVELPLWDEYDELIKSDVADVKNSGGRAAGTITAGMFLKNFIGDYRWAHLDVAGSGMTPKASGYINKGGTGAGVRLLVDMIRNWNDLGNK